MADAQQSSLVGCDLLENLLVENEVIEDRTVGVRDELHVQLVRGDGDAHVAPVFVHIYIYFGISNSERNRENQGR